MQFIKPKYLKNDDKYRWCKKLDHMVCSILCMHRKSQESKNPEYNKAFSVCIKCKGGE